MKASPVGLLVILLSGLLAVTSRGAEPTAEWPQFLGPQRNGISAETGLLDAWPASGPQVVWRQPGGVGMSGLAISRGRVLTVIERAGKQQLIALSSADGKELWLTELAPAFRNAMGNGTRATPTIDGQRVFAFTGEGLLIAVDFVTGKQLWSKDTLRELDSPQAEYGMACSPLVVGDHVVVTAGTAKEAVAAFNKETGALAWKVGRGPAGYSSPALLNVGGKNQIVVFTGDAVLGLNPETGAQGWRFPYETDFACNIATPVAYKGQVFVSAGENHGSALLALKGTNAGFEASEVWASQGPQSVLRTEWQTAILLGDHLYGFDNVGGAGPISHLTCINAASGERVWQQTRFGKGNMIAADGKLFISTMNGELVIARAAPEKYEELGRMEVLGSTRQAPALAGGLLYLRDDKEIVCLDVRKN
ncbi:Quinohemoprotein alcohol dehydrogenase ADH IIB precursor [Anatilimnocola aggregata]|uniref:Quinohemoprotein alcohol dehydrogenase ADH IIB n=1 Tax=Anatilimnocola aggregata TaxID=2528021 RepID=A0A517YLB6_9BACT|nr:PQQ-like beta-propeller repeat protein [Anatilimnocola aggregata]QDU31019.1 Quinohemoprotein alcohol dehydrogenase ADH IIB precursor [Anatilimnocola aggregata]